MKFVNLCPHDILLNNGTVLKRSGEVARVNVSFGEFDSNGICSQKFGEIQGLGPEIAVVKYVVSALVLAAAIKAGRADCVAAATGHPDCKRDIEGRIVSVPGFVV